MAVQRQQAATHRQPTPASTATGLEGLVAELSHIRDALRMFPASWEGAAAMRSQAGRIDRVLERLHRASSLPPEFVQDTTNRFALLLQNGARPQMAMQMALREAIARQFAIAEPASAEEAAA